MPTVDGANAAIYLLRCWREVGHHRLPDEGWRFSLEDPHTGERRGFTSLTALTAELAATMRAGEHTSVAVALGDGPPR